MLGQLRSLRHNLDFPKRFSFDLAERFGIAIVSQKNMKLLRAIFAGLITGASAKAADPAPAKNPSDMMREMRTAWLTKFHEKKETEKPDTVIAVLMDWPIGEQTATVLASAGGDASLYTTSTFGILGGIGHASVRKAATDFVGCAQHFVDRTTPTTDFPYPNRESVCFYMVTPSGVRIITFAMKDTEQPNSTARALFAYGQNVLTELRKTMPETK